MHCSSKHGLTDDAFADPLIGSKRILEYHDVVFLQLRVQRRRQNDVAVVKRRLHRRVLESPRPSNILKNYLKIRTFYKIKFSQCRGSAKRSDSVRASHLPGSSSNLGVSKLFWKKGFSYVSLMLLSLIDSPG